MDIDAFYDGSEDQLEARRLITTGVQLFLYGMYTPLFGVCIRIIKKRKRGNYRLHIALTTALFILCTTTVVLNLVNVSKAVKMEMPRNLSMLAVYMLANVCAELIMIQRCYVIWNENLFVIIVPVIGLCVNLAFGISVLIYRTRYLVVFLIMTLTENIILTSLTAGRIYWINREAGLILGSAVQTRYRMIAAMIMESSILYSAAIIGGVVAMFAHNVLASDIAVNAQTQLVGIAPTLLVVRVGLGVDIKDVINSVKVMSIGQLDLGRSNRDEEQRFKSRGILKNVGQYSEVPEIEIDEGTEEGTSVNTNWRPGSEELTLVQSRSSNYEEDVGYSKFFDNQKKHRTVLLE